MKTVNLPCNVKGYILYQDNEYSVIQTSGVTFGPFLDLFTDRKDISEYNKDTRKFKEALTENKLIIGNLFMPDFDLFSEKEHDILTSAAFYSSFGASNNDAWLGVGNGSYYAWGVDSDGNVSNSYSRCDSCVVAPAFIPKTSELNRYIDDQNSIEGCISNLSIKNVLKRFKII